MTADIIPHTSPDAHQPCWQEQLAVAIRDPAELLKRLNIDPTQLDSSDAAQQAWSIRAPLPYVQRMRKGDINVTMTRILRDFPQYSPKALSWPGGPHGAHAPWVVSLHDFVTDAEAEAFTSTCQKHFDRSLAGDQLSPVRTPALASELQSRAISVTSAPLGSRCEPPPSAGARTTSAPPTRAPPRSSDASPT